MVTIEENPERVHTDQYTIISKLFEPNYNIFTTIFLDKYEIKKCNGPGKGHDLYGTLSISKNNKDVTIEGNPKLFMDIATEIEKLGYSVKIVY